MSMSMSNHEHEHEQAEMLAASLFEWLSFVAMVLLHRGVLLAKVCQLVYRGPAIWAGTAGVRHISDIVDAAQTRRPAPRRHTWKHDC
jgi:hypothetical protein